MSNLLDWKPVAGGICVDKDFNEHIIQDLLWTTTQITWEQAGQNNPLGNQSHPIVQINMDEAMEIAEKLGARLPTSLEWEWMAYGADHRSYPWGNEDWTSEKANLKPLRIYTTTPVGHFPKGATPEGILDVAGNVWEWTSTVVPGNGAIIRGGSYNSRILYARTQFTNEVPQELSSKGIGLRLVKSL